ncbi:MAG: MBL fold metallo-hydrolase [Bacteroidota bacterium]
MNVGKFEIHEVNAGKLAIDGGAMFGIVPRALWSRTNPPDDQNRIAMAMRSLLIVGDGRKILIDNGAGKKLSEKLMRIYRIDLSEWIEDSLVRIGFTCDDITDVILTHLHFDHCGGSTSIERGEVVPTFRNASYYVQRAQYEWAMNPPERDEASFFPENFEPLLHMGKLVLLEGSQELFPGIELIVVNGHTPSQQLVKISGGEETVLFAADLVPLSAQLSLIYGMAYDHWPLTTIEEKKKILSQAADERWIIVFEHDPVIPAARIKKSEKGFTIEEALIVG